MFQTHSHRQGSIELVNIEDLVPQDHLLRKIDATIDFSFIAEKTRPLYCENNGRPCVDPVMLFKMLFIGYLYGIRSERRLVEEIQMVVPLNLRRRFWPKHQENGLAPLEEEQWAPRRVLYPSVLLYFLPISIQTQRFFRWVCQ
ncbi:transposase-like protein DUF772 [Planifilum fimeticola]|uniref:Transposase-like protein DUF772 n=2 Tax=Planifilum fimeticola TaxID=201975 RepID=A0A2T0LD09_9BACL|nr:transposase-like protein DUF772 [Planifilum fimeticola]